MRVLLTGAAGFVGRAVLADPGAKAHDWIAVDLAFPDGWSPPPHVEAVATLDLARSGGIPELVARERPEAVVHLAGWTGKGGSSENRERLLSGNVASTWNLLEALAARGEGRPPRFLLASTAMVYGDVPGPFREEIPPRPEDDYAISKHLAEQALQVFASRGLVVPAIVRPAVIYGPGQRGGMFVPSLVRALVRSERFPMTAGAQKRDLLHVRDAARAFVGLLESPLAGIFNAGTGRGVPMAEVGRILSRFAGREDLLDLGALPYREREIWDYAVEPTALREGLGWIPSVELEDGLAETLAEEMRS